MEIEVDRYCFVCGPENPEGLHAAFEYGAGRSRARFIPRREHQGYAGVSHGGVLAALLDEAMVYAAASLGRWVTTAEMTVRYTRPVPVATPVEVFAEVTRHQRRLVECRAEIRDLDGVPLASAVGKLLQGREIRPGEVRGGENGAEE